MAEHELKVVPPYWDAVAEVRKTFEVRRNDRGFQTGDHLILREWLPIQNRYTGRECERWVSYVYAGDPSFGGHGGMQHGYVVLGLRLAGATE